MSDRSWMLNPTAISAARACIQIVRDELDIRLKLSHPQFLELLQEYAELTDSEELQVSLGELLSLANGEVPTLNHKALHKRTSRPAAAAMRELKVVENDTAFQSSVPSSDAMVEYRGKFYPRYNAQGLEFKGLYRGQARYN